MRSNCAQAIPDLTIHRARPDTHRSVKRIHVVVRGTVIYARTLGIGSDGTNQCNAPTLKSINAEKKSICFTAHRIPRHVLPVKIAIHPIRAADSGIAAETERDV